MKIDGTWIRSAGVQTALHLLTDAGYQALLVGGCVRNAIIGQPVADIDIATDAVPERVVELCKAANLKVVPTGIDHGTVTIVVDGEPHEVTTFRRDVETDGRRAKIAYSTRIEDDAARRDFTMNALYADAAGEVIDPLCGLPDLQAGRVRFVGDANARIKEDFLRILRFFRFHAWYGDPDQGMDEEALAACASNSHGIETLSKERLGHEMRRLLAATDPAPAIATMQTSGILARILPGADSRALAPLIHIEPPLKPDWLRRLAVLGDANAAEALRLSRDETRRLECLRNGVASESPPAELAYRHDAAIARDIMLLRAALLQVPVPSGWEADVSRGANAVFPIRAADLMPALSGAALGAKLDELEARWIASDFRLSREQLLA